MFRLLMNRIGIKKPSVEEGLQYYYVIDYITQTPLQGCFFKRFVNFDIFILIYPVLL